MASHTPTPPVFRAPFYSPMHSVIRVGTYSLPVICVPPTSSHNLLATPPHQSALSGVFSGAHILPSSAVVFSTMPQSSTAIPVTVTTGQQQQQQHVIIAHNLAAASTTAQPSLQMVPSNVAAKLIVQQSPLQQQQQQWQNRQSQQQQQLKVLSGHHQQQQQRKPVHSPATNVDSSEDLRSLESPQVMDVDDLSDQEDTEAGIESDIDDGRYESDHQLSKHCNSTQDESAPEKGTSHFDTTDQDGDSGERAADDLNSVFFKIEDAPSDDDEDEDEQERKYYHAKGKERMGEDSPPKNNRLNDAKVTSKSFSFQPADMSETHRSISSSSTSSPPLNKSSPLSHFVPHVIVPTGCILQASGGSSFSLVSSQRGIQPQVLIQELLLDGHNQIGLGSGKNVSLKSISIGPIKPVQSDEDGQGAGANKVCRNCGTTETPLWRRTHDGQFICNACGIYWKTNSCARPVQRPNTKRPPSRQAKTRDASCANCGTSVTSLWRRDQDGQTVCNACGLYYKLHKEHRPIKLKKDHIKTRKRRCRGEELERATTTLPGCHMAGTYSPLQSLGTNHPSYVMMSTATSKDQHSPASDGGVTMATSAQTRPSIQQQQHQSPYSEV